MSATKRRTKAARRARWVAAANARIDQRTHRYQNSDLFACRTCGDQFGITGALETDEDWEAQNYFDDQVRFHVARECRPAGLR